MNTRSTARALVGAALALATLTPGAVHADSHTDDVEVPPFVTITGTQGPWTSFEAPIARVYGDGTAGYIAIAGGTLENVCSNDAPPAADGRFRQRPDGTFVTSTAPDGVDISLSIYETDLEVFAFFGEQCASGAPLQRPSAIGAAVLRDRSWGQPVPFAFPQIGRYRNSITGTATGADGTEYRVRAVADYEVSPEGETTFFRDELRVLAVGG